MTASAAAFRSVAVRSNTGEYRPLLVHDQTVVAVGISPYYADSTRRKLVREYHNLWILDFDDAWRCRSLTEWFMK